MIHRHYMIRKEKNLMEGNQYMNLNKKFSIITLGTLVSMSAPVKVEAGFRDWIPSFMGSSWFITPALTLAGIAGFSYAVLSARSAIKINKLIKERTDRLQKGLKAKETNI